MTRFSLGGAVDPVLGTRLVKVKRPGAELVVAATKSVALLGVIGRADDMHAILDAESDATLAYLESWFERQGGRRGRGQARTRTSGLLWARHGGGARREPRRDHGRRMAGAAVAVELGYAIEPDDGPTGKLGHWRITGIPRDACDVLSKRSEEIDLHMESSGFQSYRARGIGARATRDAKSDESPEALQLRWIDELDGAGWPIRKITHRLVAINDRARDRALPTDADLQQLASAVLSLDGELGNRKAFTRLDIVRVLAPSRYGLPPQELDRAVQAVIDHHQAIPLVGQPAARGRAWASASVLGLEQAVAETSRRLASRDAAAVSPAVITNALTAKEHAIGGTLTPGQVSAVSGICAEGRGLDLIIGTAGSGKTTALDAVRAAFEAGGYRVLGAATSGQAARALGEEADVNARTIASLLWRLQAGTLSLDTRTALLLDEAGMTDDRSMLAVLKAAEQAYAKVVVIGDHRQLSAVGLGGGLEALAGRHADAVHVLDDNVRQHDPAERAALAQLRDGKVDVAIEWYRSNDRLVPAETRDEAIDAAVDAWLADETSGKRTLLLAWRRADVAELNRRARQRWADTGRLAGADFVSADGKQYAVGDRVVALAPTRDGALTTSERGTVVAVHDTGIVVRSDAGRQVDLTGEAADAKHLDHAYAVTVHRAQGATVDRTHLLADGGGRELAYVAMSRARESTLVHVVADDLEQAIEDLGREWSTERRDRWTIDTDSPAAPGDRRRPDLAARVASGLRAARLRAERDAVLATIPPDVTAEWTAAHVEVHRIEIALKDLRTGRGSYADTPVGDAYRDLQRSERDVRTAEEVLGSKVGWKNRRFWTRQHRDALESRASASERFTELAAPIEADLTESLDGARDDRDGWQKRHEDRQRVVRMAGIARRLVGIEREIGVGTPGYELEIDRGHGIEL